MPVTIHDVARLAKVSPGTVSRVIHKRDYVRQETKQRVLEAIEKLGYRPHAAASRLGLRKTFVLGLLVPNFQKEYYVEIAEAVTGQRDFESAGIVLRESCFPHHRGLSCWSLVLSRNESVAGSQCRGPRPPCRVRGRPGRPPCTDLLVGKSAALPVHLEAT